MKKFIWNQFPPGNLKKEINPTQLSLNSLQPFQINYLHDLTQTTEQLLGKGSIDAVILFGSASHDITSPVSDVDVLILVKNYITPQNIKHIDPILSAIEIKHNLKDKQTNLISKVVQVVNRKTGMFCSYFICRHIDWDQRNFPKIFSTSKSLTYFLAPNEIILESMKAGAKILYGDASISNLNHPISKVQLIKSMIMNLLLWIGAIFLTPWNKKYMIYFLEAYKWSLRSCSFTLFKYIRPLQTIVRNYERIATPGEFIRRFRILRQKIRVDLAFALSVPYHIIKMHSITFRYLNDPAMAQKSSVKR